MGGRGLVVIVLACAACSEPPLDVRVPVVPGARAHVVRLEDGGRVEILGFEAGNGEPLRVEREEISNGRALSIIVVAYSQTLDELRLVEGALESTAGGDPLPDATLEQRTLVVTADGPGEWTKLPSFPAELASFLRPRQRCRPLVLGERWEVPVAPYLSMHGLVSLANGMRGVLIRRSDLTTAIYVPESGGQLTPTIVIPSTSNGGIYPGRGRSDSMGRLWLSGGTYQNGGAILRVENTSLSFPLPATPGARYADWIEGFMFDPVLPDDAIVGVSNGGRLVRWSASEGFRTLTATQTYAGIDKPPSLAAVGEDDFFFVRPGGPLIERWQRGVHSVEETAIEDELEGLGEHIVSLAVTPSGEAFAGTQAGLLLHRRPDARWDVVGGTPLLVDATLWALVPFGDDGLLVAGDYGSIREYDIEKRDYCVERSFTSNTDEIRYAELVGDDLWLAGWRRDINVEDVPFLTRLQVRSR